MKRSFLLIGNTVEDEWTLILRRALAPLGSLYVRSDAQANQTVGDSNYDMVIVDAGTVRDAALLVSRLRASRTDLRIVVFTSSPTWQRAREALRAGAADYLRKSLNEKKLRSLIESVLELPPLDPEQ